MKLELRKDPRDLHEAYAGATPFPHIVVDDLFPDDQLEQVLREFPSSREGGWRRFDSATEKKLGFRHDNTEIGTMTREFLFWMNSFEMLAFLETLTGIDGLIPDPYFGGGGLHQIERGGFLNVHADFNWHPKLRLDRRLNMLVYLNRDWPDEYGGNLELWDGSSPVHSIQPLFNRTVVFSTTDQSFHGHPQPLSCPPGRSRKSVSLYYYTNGRPESERSAAHDTIFLEK
ncbi:MAG: 2OG-Fe(II) oxygenase [Acidobacteriota bacterium]